LPRGDLQLIGDGIRDARPLEGHKGAVAGLEGDLLPAEGLLQEGWVQKTLFLDRPLTDDPGTLLGTDGDLLLAGLDDGLTPLDLDERFLDVPQEANPSRRLRLQPGPDVGSRRNETGLTADLDDDGPLLDPTEAAVAGRQGALQPQEGVGIHPESGAARAYDLGDPIGARPDHVTFL
jgi:hypothetical protein